MDAKSELGNLMPDSLTKWLLWLSIVIPPILYGVYPDLPKSWKPQTEEQQFLTRLLLSGSALLLGSLSLVILLARHDKMMRLQNAELMNTLDVVSTDAQENGKTVKSLQSKLAVAAQERDTLQTFVDEARQKLTEQQTTIDTLSKTTYDVLKHNKPPQLIPKFGVLWDNNKEAYCPIAECKTLLSRYTEEQRESGDFSYYFICPKCRMPRYLQDDATPITLDEAKKRL